MSFLGPTLLFDQGAGGPPLMLTRGKGAKRQASAHIEEMKPCCLLVAQLAGKMDGQKAACRGRKWACRCMYTCECVL